MDMRHLLEQAKNLEKALAEIDERLKSHVSDGSGADGEVTVQVDGAGDVLSLTVSKDFHGRASHEELQQAILTALREATKASREYREKERATLTGGLKLPDL